jgi:putative Mg2+ transporter-C (MgtC) family protein
LTLESLLTELRDLDAMLPLLCSLVAGALIGVEREFQGKPAGLRTHTLVCFAAALMTMLGLRMDEWSTGLPEGAQVVSDMARMPHAILTGIGFLGAGVIFREGASVQGLTTAASLWLTAALGIVFGAGLLELATIGTVIALLVLVLLRLAQRSTFAGPSVRIEVRVDPTAGFDLTQLQARLRDHGLRPGATSRHDDLGTGQRRYLIVATARARVIDCDGLSDSLLTDSGVQAVSVEAVA